MTFKIWRSRHNGTPEIKIYSATANFFVEH